MQTQSSVSEFDEQLSAYFDDELEPAARAQVEAELERDPELAARLLDLSFMRTMVVGDLDHQAERVPEARFEQIWDSFEDSLVRESRLQEAAEAPPGLWQRLREWVRPIRYPLGAVAAVGALAFIIARSVGAPSEDQGKLADNAQPGGGAVESSAPQGDPAGPSQPGPRREDNSSSQGVAAQNTRAPATSEGTAAPQIAVAPAHDTALHDETFPQPEPGEAEIRRIEFGGQTGTISQVEGSRGTTTVIWVTEDEQPVDSERSL